MAAAKSASKEQTPQTTPAAPHEQSPVSSDPSPAEAPVVAVSADSTESVNRVLRYHVWTSMGVGLIPVPIADLVALTGVQANLLRVLAKIYHVPFRKGIVRNVISALAGGALPVITAPAVAASVTKTIPVVGQTAGVVTMPIIAGATTYAIGKIFIQHFASGGTFLTFDPEKVKDYYAEMLKEGQNVAGNLKSEK